MYIWYICIHLVYIMIRVFGNRLGDWGSIPDRVILKTQKMILDAAFA